MDNSTESLAQVCGLFQNTLSDVKLVRAKAEHELTTISVNTGFSTLLLKALTIPNDQLPASIKLAMAAYFKNYVKNKWAEDVISDSEKENIKGILPTLMLELEPQLRRIIAASLYTVSSFDFPEKWPTLLPSLIEKLKCGDPTVINGVLKTIDAIFKRFRGASDRDDKQMTHLKYSLESFTQPFLYLFTTTTQQIISTAEAKPLEALFKIVRHLCSIFHSLNSATIPEFMEDNLSQFMGSFKYFLTYKSTLKELLEVRDEDDAPGLLTKVQVSVLTIINLYCEKYEEEFQPFIQEFVTEVWQLLLTIGKEPKFDTLVTSALQFLTTISTGVFYTLFSDDNILTQICNNVIVPNIKLRKSDKELFEDDPMSYIAKDVEGNDDGTRRRSAYLLVLGLRKNFEEKLTGLFSSHINTLLAEYNQDPNKNWYSKDAAVYLIIALAATKGTSEKGVTTVNALVPILEFYKSQILVELNNAKCPELLLCSCLNFATTFRRQLSLEDFYNLLNTAISPCLKKNSVALRSYASITVERFLSIREDNNQYRFQKEHIQQLIGPIFEGLFAALDCQSKAENPYVMKAIAQVLTIIKDGALPYIAPAIDALSQKLTIIYPAPVNAEFGHFMFESLAAIISVTCKIEQSNIDKFEGALFPVFSKILTEPEAGTFSPYVFQIMAQFIELRRSLQPQYLPLIVELTQAQFWEEVGNRPALVRLIQAFITYGPNTFNASNLPPILGIFQKLLSNKQQDYLSFFLLESVVISLDKNIVAPFMPQIMKLIFTRISSSKTEQLVRAFIVFLSNFIAAHGVAYALEQVNSIQNGIFSMVLTSLWIPNVPKISGKTERKAIACGSIALLDSDLTGSLMQNDQGANTLRDFIISLIQLFTGETTASVDNSYVDVGELIYNSGFNALKMATKLPTDYFHAIESAQVHFAQTLKTMSTKYGQKLSQILGSLPQENQNSLMEILKNANVTL